MKERDLFIGALERTDPVERAAFLGHGCEGDLDLRQWVEVLLEAHEDVNACSGAPASDATTSQDTPESPSDGDGDGPGAVPGPERPAAPPIAQDPETTRTFTPE